MDDESIIIEQPTIEYDSVGILENGNTANVESETLDIIEVSPIDTITVGTDEAFPELGEQNPELNHPYLRGRELPNQHPISSISGLKEELDNIKSLKTIYSNKKNHADYFMWQDNNPMQDNRVGLFVTTCSDTNQINICTNKDDIFGVTVDDAGFIGGQSDIKRDSSYGLVVCTGIVAVQCEIEVAVGDFVVSNGYGLAQKSNSGYGYKVIAIQNVNGTTYAIIPLGIPINKINDLMNEFHNFDERMDKAEANIVSAIKVANEAHNKAIETLNISDEAMQKVIEAEQNSKDAMDNVENLENMVSSANKTAEQAKAIANTAVNSAEAIRGEASKTANNALSGVNNLVAELEPITKWQDVDSGNTGAEYLVNYIRDGLATKEEIHTVETLTEENKTAIQTNAQSIKTMVSSVDKYSVGEYSQAYGLTQEQAGSILKDGMIYIPTKHRNKSENPETHSETYVGEDGDLTQEFTQGYHYIWNNNMWIESSNPSVYFTIDNVPTATDKYIYWYIDGDTAPDGYEPRTLYIYKNNQWIKVNMLGGNVTNRVVSMIQQKANEISLDVTNARGDISSHQQWIDDNGANIQDVITWKSQVQEDVSSIATIKQTADDAGASVAQVAAKICGEYTTLVGIWDETDKDTTKVYYTVEDKKYWYYEGDTWVSTNYPTEAGLEINAASIVTAINNDTSSITLNADKINLNGAITANGSFQIDENGYMTAVGGTIGGWNIKDGFLETVHYDTENNKYHIFIQGNVAPNLNLFSVRKNDTAIFNIDKYGRLTATNADISGKISASSGSIGGWNIDKYGMKKTITSGGSTYLASMQASSTVQTATAAFLVQKDGVNQFYVTYGGYLYSRSGNIAGWKINPGYLESTYTIDGTGYQVFLQSDLQDNLNAFTINKIVNNVANTVFTINKYGEIHATIGSFGRDIKIGGRSISNWITSGGYINEVKAVTGTVGGWQIYKDKLIGIENVGSDQNAVELNPTGFGWTWDIYDAMSYVDWSTLWEIARDKEMESDVNVKNSISEYNEQYELLFDNLKPCRYKYNYGTSNRFHTGFIAQEVVDSLERSGLSTQDFAAVIHLEHPFKNGAAWLLRRDEFVALNTWQIQKAKARITELENRVAELELRIKGE